MQRMSWILIGLLVIGGCAWIHQAKQDYQTGAMTPLVAGEISSHDQAVRIEQPFEQLPYGHVARIGIPVLTLLLTYFRGRRLRQQSNRSALPATGSLGVKTGLEALVQMVATLSQGIFEWGANGTGLKRGIKTVVAIGLSLLTAAAASPALATLIASHAGLLSALTGLSAIISAVEKSLSQVLPRVSTTEDLSARTVSNS